MAVVPHPLPGLTPPAPEVGLGARLKASAKHSARALGLAGAQVLLVARREAERHNQSIRVLGPDALWAAPGKFDLVTCYLLFQRLAPAEGLALLKQMGMPFRAA